MTLHKAFDGEVYYWWDDDRQQASKVPPKKGKPIVTNDKDRATAKRIIKRYLDNDTNDYQFENEFTTALTTVRKEAREAALRGAANTVYAMSRIDARDQSVAFLNGAIWMQDKAAKLIESTIEAAANT